MFLLILLAVSLGHCYGITESPQSRAAALLAQMNITEKINLMHGVGGPYTGQTVSNSRLGIPALTLNDGRQGFRGGPADATAWPCQLSVVATFDIAMMQSFGAAMGYEFYQKGANVMLAPMLILARVPQGGRNFESIGEDPELAHDMAFAHATGVQSVPGVIVNIDDFVLNNQETDRTTISATCDERTRFELYYRGYEGGIQAGVGSVMCSYNRIDGTYACENEMTLGDLRSPQGLNFSGWVLSDWGGTHSTVPALLAGLDQQMPDDSYFGAALTAALSNGSISQGNIDTSVLRILTPMFAAGLFDGPPNTGTPSVNTTSAAHNALARSISAAGTVLLSNKGGLLPLFGGGAAPGPAPVSIVVIGDDGDADPRCCGAGSGDVTPPYVVTPFQGIAARAALAGANVNVTYLPSPPQPGPLVQFYSPIRGDHFLDFVCIECPPDYMPLRSEGFGQSTPDATSSEELVLYWNQNGVSNCVTTAAYPPSQPGYVYVRPIGYVLPLSYSGSYSTAILELWSGTDLNGTHTDYFTLSNNASRAEAIAAGYTKIAELARIYLDAVPGSLNATIAAAAAADYAIVCMGSPSGEGSDRPNLELSPSDNQLVAAITTAQPKTIVVLHNPGAVTMADWGDAAGAILAAWFPGQEMGNALADVLFGDVNPSGRTPVTFPMLDSETPLQSPEQYPGIDGAVNYTEQLLIGYRWFDSAAVTPRFAFGHGLSYTSFVYSNLSLAVSGAGQSVAVTISLDIRNAGAVDGREIPQLYISFPSTAGEPPQVLRAFQAVPIAAGSVASVTFRPLEARDLSIWDTGIYGWSPIYGTFGVRVGASSADIRLSDTFIFTAEQGARSD